MIERTPAELAAEKQAEETVDTTGNLTDEADLAGDVDKQEESPYAKQLEELRKRAEGAEAKLKEKEDLIEHKNRAIEASKKKLKEIPAEDEIADRMLAKLEARQSERDVAARVNAITADEAEREVIMSHYKSSIQKTGNVDNDLKMAVALADSDKVWEQRRNRAMEERREDFMTSFANTSLRGDAGGSKIRDPIYAAAAQLVQNINPKAVGRLDEYFKK